MIDHLLGRPSVTFRKYQVGLAVAFWSAYLLRGNRHGPPGARRLSTFLSKRLTAWQTLVLTLIWLYVARNFGKIIGLECPEPLANLYSKSYFRATYVTTALDAGFWSAMHIRRKWARDLMSVVCSVYYLVCAEQADEKVRKVRSVVTIDHLRVAWNKSLTPYLSTVTRLQRPRFMRYQPRAIRIPRPGGSSYADPVNAWLYFDGPLSSLKRQTKLVLNIPGGGFVAMSPRTHDDSLFAWAGKTGLPILSLDYRKAPEYPYPYALNECFDVYRMVIASRGRCLGLSGDILPQVIISGDSAGGNLAAGTTLMILQTASSSGRKRHSHEALPKPTGLVLIYPALDVNIGNWLTDEQMSFIRDPKARTTNRRMMQHKSQNFRRLAPTTPLPSDDSDSDSPTVSSRRKSSSKARETTRNPAQGGAVAMQAAISLKQPLKTRLAVPSLISYVSDRVLTPEMLRAMIILYIGPHSRPDFATDFLLSPVLAPDFLLAQFPKTYFLTGERDPLVDDTVIMAGRIRAAKSRDWHDRQELDMLSHDERRRGWRDQDHVSAKLVQGISHGFIQFGSIFPEAWDYIHEVGRWYTELFESADRRLRRELLEQQREMAKTAARGGGTGRNAARHKRNLTGVSSGEDEPLEMSSLRLTKKSPPPPQQQANGSPRPNHIDISTAHSFDDSIPPTPYPYTPAPSSPDLHRRKSLVSLGSEDDLLGRRMKGLAGGLTSLRGPDG